MIILTKILHIFILILKKCIPFGIEIFILAQKILFSTEILNFYAI